MTETPVAYAAPPIDADYGAWVMDIAADLSLDNVTAPFLAAARKLADAMYAHRAEPCWQTADTLAMCEEKFLRLHTRYEARKDDDDLSTGAFLDLP